MTIPSERTSSVVQTQEFLLQLVSPAKTPGVPKKVRERARQLLKHFPSELDLRIAIEKAPDVFGASEFMTNKSDWKSES